ncbi:MAG: acetyl-CoA hydrolase/transferase C-terminal domain-containing protein [Pseudomonadota bacterium]
MSNTVPTVEECVEQAIARVGKNLVIGAPLALGKPVQLLNAFYRRVEADPSLTLQIVTALCLEVPKPASHIEAGLAEPILERLFGDYEELAFVQPLRNGTLPHNIRVSEVYFKAGSMKNLPVAQQNYISSNYTHIGRDMLAFGMNILVQLVAAKESEAGLRLSLSCNPDVTLELIDRKKEADLPIMLLAQVHQDLPFMEHDAEVAAEEFDLVVNSRQYDRRLFAVPNAAVPPTDYATALHASTMIRDGGTLQIGIGSLGDAITHACVLRQHQNDEYRQMVDSLSRVANPLREPLGTFDEGLYVSTEMFVNGMMHLIEQGVVKRPVFDSLPLQQGLNSGTIEPRVDERLINYGRQSGLIPRELSAESLAELRHWGIMPASAKLEGGQLTVDGTSTSNDMDDRQTREMLLNKLESQPLRNGRVLHGGFFLGPADFYRKLRDLDPAGHEQICMTGVRRTNQLLLNYPLYCAQRTNARFINTGMKVALNGSVASDALEDGTVISGVGGQYNFVAMAHDLPGARSILCIRSTRGHGRDLESNVVPFYGHTTIPKHLRDVIVTEYGVADLRGQSDATVIKRLINIADSRFQHELLAFAKDHGKIERDYFIADEARQNTPERIRHALRPFQEGGQLPAYPLGTDLTEQEIALAASLRKIKDLSTRPGQFIAASFRALLHKDDEEAARPFLERVHLDHPETTKDFLVQQLLLMELEERGLLKVS